MQNIFQKYNFELSSKPELADYASTVLMNEKTADKNLIIKELEGDESVEKVEIKNNFINIRVSDKFLQKQIDDILNDSKKKIDDSPAGGKKFLLEFISANPTGPLTLGNGRGGFSGDVLSKILRFVGNKIEREFYINDVGNQIDVLAKSLQNQKSKPVISTDVAVATERRNPLILERDPSAKPALSEAEWARDDTGGEEQLYRGEYIAKLAKKAPEKDVGQWAMNEILENYLKPAIKKMGIGFDNWKRESEFAGKKIDEIIAFLKSKNLTYEKDGALWLKITELGGDKDDVLIRSNGEHTYFVADIAYHKDKIERGFDTLINFWGADHAGHVKRLELVIEKILRPELKWAGKIKFIVFQLVHLFENGKEVRMSKRAGTYVTMDELLDEVGVDATRWFFLDKGFNTHINFDLGLAKKQGRENPVFYVQYAYARIASVLAKSKISLPSHSEQSEESSRSADARSFTPSGGVQDDITPEERRLILKLNEFDNVIKTIAENYELQKLPKYTYEVAEAFHRFYDSCPILTADEEVKNWRLALLGASSKVLKNCFDLLGIEAKERM